MLRGANVEMVCLPHARHGEEGEQWSERAAEIQVNATNDVHTSGTLIGPTRQSSAIAGDGERELQCVR